METGGERGENEEEIERREEAKKEEERKQWKGRKIREKSDGEKAVAVQERGVR